MCLLKLCLFLLFYIVFFPLPGVCKNYYVSPSGTGEECTETNPCNFQKALSQAAANNLDDEIIVLPGTYRIPTTLKYVSNIPPGNGNLIIKASDPQGDPPVMDGQNAKTLLFIQDLTQREGKFIQISGIKFTHGSPSDTLETGGVKIITKSSNILIEACHFIENHGIKGGALYVFSLSGNIELRHNSFLRNEVIDRAGGAYLEAYNIHLVSNSFIENTSHSNIGAVEAHATNFNSDQDIFMNNRTEIHTGALSIETQSSAHIKQTSFIENSAKIAGGLYANSKGEITVLQCLFQDNSAQEFAAASLYTLSKPLLFQDNRVIENEALMEGGGIELGSRDRIITKWNYFARNKAGREGGGLICGDGYPSSTELEGNIFVSNEAGTQGGGAFLGLNQGELISYNNIFFRNKAGEDGGGLYIDIIRTYTLKLINNTFYQNEAENGHGGGIALLSRNDTSKLYIVNNIIYDNQASSGDDLYLDPLAGGNSFENGFVYLLNNDLGPETDFQTCQAGDFVNTQCDRFQALHNISGDPYLVAPENENFHLRANSPCIDAGDQNYAVSRDFEGDDRLRGEGIDLGADESPYGEWPLGDVDHSGTLTIIDALLIARYALALDLEGTFFDQDLANVTCGSTIKITDALLVARKALRLPIANWCGR